MKTNESTPQEIESLRIAIAEECGWAKVTRFFPLPREVWALKGRMDHQDEPPPYTEKLDAIQAAALERFKTYREMSQFEKELLNGELTVPRFIFIRTPLDWCIAFARTAKIWRFKQ